MDQLQKKHIDTKRGFSYTYYISPAEKADSSKPVLLLCHGWPDNAHMWQWVVPHLLKTKNRIIVPDLLGYGGTSKPTDPKDYEIKGMTDDILEIFETEKIDSQIIPVGHDWGSYFAQRVYLLNKSRTAGLITLNVALMPPRSDAFDLDTFNAYTEKTIGYPAYAYWELFSDPEGPRTVMDPNLESLYYAIHGDSDDWMKAMFCTRGAIRAFVSQGRKDVPLKKYAQDESFKTAFIAEKKDGGMTAPGCWYRAMRENYQLPTEKKLAEQGVKVDQPYLFIGCTGDAVCRTDAIEIPKQAGIVSDVEVRELESGHWCPFEKPEEVGGIVVEWLGKKGFA
ncbi:hypothetical protein M409DRAFT_67050 [Zasmidium cellare ATCC 36951]|uniref:AB hydrolase-1 domain-containing protein n=1 Tax=Zasmidium cellare ATCC 36951 TaxID=1080233 RepID=A0A6A6CEM9_ZASCE|nr:uncharacterized protein M409DRAFT_67050 [Zasmidium cellare ATCC 36951]KAF2165667.1 hypothetical protein M409DRAFT_67050 [Zasmidium cellare ATCC 36951]